MRAVAERSEAPDGVRHRILGPHVVPGATGRVAGPSEHHERHLLFLEKRASGVVDEGPRQDEPVDLVLVDELPHGGQGGGVAVRGRHRERPALAARDEGDPGEEVGEKRPVGVVFAELDDETKRPRPPGLDRLSVAERPVAELACDAADPLPGTRGNVRIAVEGTRHRALGHAELGRNIGDGDPSPAPVDCLSLVVE